MKIRIRMISGESYEFENEKYNNIWEWIRGNFKNSDGSAWFQISRDCNFVIKIDNIESIEVIKNENNFK